MFVVMIPGILVVLGWTALSVYGLVKLIGSGSDAPSASGMLLAVVIMVTLLAGLLVGAIKLLGRTMEPAKRGERTPAEV